ncbi:Phytanoyl-CoA dioxygenase family protein [Pleurostoma richardsiae]|uniref:Phytanoyl-CoA dioxygenase family protein n=1 Tax=Pleurostoma richardsiae TaxID=41990 RepID=A0AA38S130_9PEZI|nr:Phytanoyl-CoA dioxygenase family protein [Pleurostoma richardsiae]
MAPSAVAPDVDIAPVTGKASSASPITVLNGESAAVDQIVAALIKDGGVIIRNFVPQSILESLRNDLKPWLDKDEGYSGAFFPKETRKVLGLAQKSSTFCSDILLHPLWKGVYDAMLTTTTQSWNGDELNTCVSKPQLSATGLLAITPGAKAQPLHRDDMIHHADLPAITAEQYKIGRDTSVGLFVAGTRFHKANGATRFVPGSHLQASLEKPSEDGVVYAELQPGDAFMMLASCYHGGSANLTQDEERWVYATFMTKGWLRQEENQFLTVTRERLLEYPEHVQKKLGYELSQPYMGWVDLADPLAFVKGEETKPGDLF